MWGSFTILPVTCSAGVYKWSDGSRLRGYKNWRGGAPAGGEARDCTQLMAGTGKWVEIGCDQRLRYVCLLPPTTPGKLFEYSQF